jgi:FLYWCH zinc finger domain
MDNIMTSTIRYGVTKRGQRTVIYLNYEYWRFKDYIKGHTLWRCTMHQRSHCKAMLVTNDNRVIGNQCPEHTHSGNATTKPARNDEVCGTASLPPINNTEHTNKFILMDPRNARLLMKERNWTTLDQKISSAPNSDDTNLIGNLSPEHIHNVNITAEHIWNENVRSTTSMTPTNNIEHSKKYVLVDPQSTKPPLIENNLTNLDQAISEALNSSLSGDSKAMQYMQALRTFTNYDALSPAPITEDATVSIHPANQYKASNTEYEFIDNNNSTDPWRYLNAVEENKKKPKRRKMMKKVKQNWSKVIKENNLSKKPKTAHIKWIEY